MDRDLIVVHHGAHFLGRIEESIVKFSEIIGPVMQVILTLVFLIFACVFFLAGENVAAVGMLIGAMVSCYVIVRVDGVRFWVNVYNGLFKKR